MNVKGELICWARERAQLSVNEAAKKIQVKEEKFKSWEQGKASPTCKQLEKIAEKFYVPFGYLFLSEPPEEKLPLPMLDFRTRQNSDPSPELLEVIYDAQRKQNWLREQKTENNEPKIILRKERTEREVIEEIRNLLGAEDLRKQSKDPEDFLKNIIDTLDKKEFLVIRNGVVFNNTHRPLNVDEFKGFALFDEHAPLIFINGKDFKSSQIFTVMHELAHLFLGESALDGKFNENETKCNKIAAEILVPGKKLKEEFTTSEKSEIEKVAKKFKVSLFVVLIRAKDCSLINQEKFEELWEISKQEIKEKPKRDSTGGDYYANAKFKAGGKHFLSRVLYSTLAGETLYRDAYKLTGLNGKNFDKCYEEAKGVFK